LGHKINREPRAPKGRPFVGQPGPKAKSLGRGVPRSRRAQGSPHGRERHGKPARCEGARRRAVAATRVRSAVDISFAATGVRARKRECAAPPLPRACAASARIVRAPAKSTRGAARVQLAHGSRAGAARARPDSPSPLPSSTGASARGSENTPRGLAGTGEERERRCASTSLARFRCISSGIVHLKDKGGPPADKFTALSQ
jgi:hypothetical protein